MKEKVISMAKKESQDGKSKKGLPRLMELAMTQKAPMVGGMILSAMATIASFLPYLAIYFIIQEVVGAYPDFGVLDVPKVLGYGGMALGGVLLNVLLYTASVALSHIAAYGTMYQCNVKALSVIFKVQGQDLHSVRIVTLMEAFFWTALAPSGVGTEFV